MTTPGIEASGVSIDLAASRILEHIDIRAAAGEFVGIIGPNGAGKSTLLRALAGMLEPAAGTLSVDGTSMKTLPMRELARRVAVVPQSTTLDFAFTVREIVLMGRHPHLGRFAIEGETDLRIAHEALARTGMAQFVERTITSLSGGESQLVFLAKALAQQPRILLLDEPISALDIRHQLEVLQLVRGLTDGGLVTLAALHDLDLAARFCTRLVLMAGGRVLADGRPEQVLTPEALRASYGVRAAVRIDPDTHALTVTALDIDHLVAGPPEPARSHRHPLTVRGGPS